MDHELGIGEKIIDFMTLYSACKQYTWDKLQLQVVILSFCRGGIPSVYNRLPDAHEVKHLPEILQSSDFAPSKKPLPAKMRRKEHKVHPFPDIEVPVNCHVYFTTLPDSK